MNSKYADALTARDQHIKTLRLLCAGLAVACLGIWWAGLKNPSDFTLHVPPDLSAGSVQRVGEVPKPNIYAFAYYIFQQLNRWQTNGEDEYPKKIERLQCYLTPAFQNQLKSDLASRRVLGELRDRERSVAEVAGRGFSSERVFAESQTRWQVFLDIEVRESFKGQSVKLTHIRYPMRVVAYDVDRECNPWGLALDGYVEEPRRLTVETASGGKES